MELLGDPSGLIEARRNTIEEFEIRISLDGLSNSLGEIFFSRLSRIGLNPPGFFTSIGASP